MSTYTVRMAERQRDGTLDQRTLVVSDQSFSSVMDAMRFANIFLSLGANPDNPDKREVCWVVDESNNLVSLLLASETKNAGRT